MLYRYVKNVLEYHGNNLYDGMCSVVIESWVFTLVVESFYSWIIVVRSRGVIMTQGDHQKNYENEEANKRTDSIESTLAEKIASLLEGEVRAKEDLAHKTMQIMSQKDLELAGLNEKIRLLESLNRKKRGVDSLDGMGPGIVHNTDYLQELEDLKSGKCTPICDLSSVSDLEETDKNGLKRRHVKYESINTDNLPKEDLRNLQILNTKLLSAIYNDTQLRRDEQLNFMKIVTQLSDVVKELKDQNNSTMNNKPDCNMEQTGLKDQQYGKTCSPSSSPRKIFAERDYDSPPIPLDLKELQSLTTNWNQVFKSSSDSDNSSIPNSVVTLASLNYKGLEQNKKISKENNKNIPKKIQNKSYKDRFRQISLKFRRQEKLLAKTRFVLKQFQDQGKTILSMVEEIKQEQNKEKLIIESLMCKTEKMSKNDYNFQSLAIKEIDDRIERLEFRLSENTGRVTNKDKEIRKLMEELKQANLIKDEYQNKTIQLNAELSEYSAKLNLNKKQIEELKETIRKEKALNESMKKAYEMNLRNVVGNTVQEQRHLVQEIKMTFDNNITALQMENSELKTRIGQLEEESKKICNDSKIRVVKAKKQLYSQASIASQKLLKADCKIKEFFYAIEKLLKGIYFRLYEAELEHIKKKCHEEGGVQAASYILGVSATQMSRVLAAGSLPSLQEWLESCKRLVYKEKFAEELANYIQSLFWPILPKDITKGAGDS